ncbi:MAG: class I SAM-dependent methyltransferase [Acidimicrobiia bacterium]|nr:class I SAM-dependent methyltransferase [Acidimicrobiia bacterium]
MHDDGTEFWESMYSAGRIESPLDPMILELAPTLPIGSFLDLGCGAGQNSIWLAQRGWDVTGVDIAPSAIRLATEAARDMNVTATFLVADLTEWIPEGGFDFVASTYALPPAGPGRSHALAGAAAAVNPGGTILVAEFDRTSLGQQEGWMSDRDVTDVDELASHLGGFDITKLTVETTRHAHGHDEQAYPVAVAIAHRTS